MEVIKRKIAALKTDIESKDDEIATLRAELKHEKIEREKAEAKLALKPERFNY